MLKIGLFSKLSRVSIRMLRYYDEMGLLRPAYIDPDSDYRYYREDQLQTVGWITALRDMGFSLADVRRMSQLGRDAEALAPFFAARRRELQAETAKTAQQLLLLDTAEKRLGKEDFMQYNITLKTIRRAMPPVSIPSSRAIRTKAKSGRRSAPRPTTCTSSRTTPATARSPSSTGNSRRPTWSSRRGRPSRARTPTRRT